MNKYIKLAFLVFALALATDDAMAQKKKTKKKAAKKKGEVVAEAPAPPAPEPVKEPEKPKKEPKPTPNADPYVRELSGMREAMAYEKLRESDVMFQRRVWRKLDLKEKMNHPLYYPHNPINGRRCLTQILMDAVKDGKLVAYGYNESQELDGANYLTYDEFQATLVGEASSYTTTDPVTGLDTTIVIPAEPFNLKDVTTLMVKEDWVFNKQTSVLEARISAIAPVRDKIVNGEYRGIQPMFWVDFREARPILVQNEVANRQNDAQRLTFDDLFAKRQFSSYIYKSTVGNPYDRDLAEYLTPFEALLESDKIRDGIVLWEHDLWEF
jgi:gliding motility associated protien GldN